MSGLSKLLYVRRLLGDPTYDDLMELVQAMSEEGYHFRKEAKVNPTAVRLGGEHEFCNIELQVTRPDETTPVLKLDWNRLTMKQLYRQVYYLWYSEE